MCQVLTGEMEKKTWWDTIAKFTLWENFKVMEAVAKGQNKNKLRVRLEVKLSTRN